MRRLANLDPQSMEQVIKLLEQARAEPRSVAVVAGGSDLLGMIKEGLLAPDTLLNLKSLKTLDTVAALPSGLRVGGLVTLETLGHHSLIRSGYAVLAEAAESVATPQIRNLATLAGNICQRPWCWYFRRGFPCLKNEGDICYSFGGENQLHAIFEGGPCYHTSPSDTAPALLALEARFRIVGPAGERTIPASEFFALPIRDVSRENVLEPDEVLAEIELPAAPRGQRSAYTKVMDRQAWNHAVVSVAMALKMKAGVCQRARIVLGGVAPIPWRLPEVEEMLIRQRPVGELAASAGRAAVRGAEPLSRNHYKVPLVEALVRRSLLSLVA